jgi:hypothetical protein
MRLVALSALIGCNGAPSKPAPHQPTPGAGSTPDPTLPSDLDDDGFGVADGDCDDDDPQVHPGAPEVCNGIDDDCDALDDEDDPDVTGTHELYADGDADGYGDPLTTVSSCAAAVAGHVDNDDDCDDADADVRPEGVEVCNGYDDDCDALADLDDPDLASCHPALTGGALGADRLEGVAVAQKAGIAVAGLGDVDGDGLGDLGVLDETGSAWVVLGDAVPLGVAPITTADELTAGRVWGLGPAGDGDADGFDDFVVSTTDPNGYGSTAVLVRGSPASGPLDTVPDRFTTVDTDGAFSQVAGGRDTNGDGTPEVLLGAPLGSTEGLFAGVAYLADTSLTGEHALATDALARFHCPGSALFAMLGREVHLPGDLDGDGLADLVISSADKAHVLYGPRSGDVDVCGSADATLAGETSSGTGSAVVDLGDVDGDGLVDLAVGSPYAGTTGIFTGDGAVYVVTGAPTGAVDLPSASLHAKVTGPATWTGFGKSVSTSDLDGDGDQDLLVTGAELYLFLDPLVGTQDTSAAVAYTAPDVELVAGIGDFDGDGFDDLALGGPATAAGGNVDAGAVFLLYGAP